MPSTAPIQFVDDTPATALANAIEDYENLAGRTVGAADPEMLLVTAYAYRMALLLGQVNYTGNQNLINQATGASLDQLGQKSGTYRLAASAAVVTIKFTVGTGAGAFVIPANTRVQAASGNVIFGTKEDTDVTGPGTYNIDCTCTQAGAIGNGYTAGLISVIVDPIAYVVSASNTDTSGGGSDQETDDQLRARIPLANATYSVAGPTDAYIYFAKSASPSIVDVSVVTALLAGAIVTSAVDAGGTGYAVNDTGTIDTGTYLATYVVESITTGGVVGAYKIIYKGSGYSTGTGITTTATSGAGTGFTINITALMPLQTICIYPLLANGVIPNTAMLDLVQAACSDEKVRPLSDTVLALAPTATDYSLSVQLTIKKAYDSNAIVNQVMANLTAFVNQWSNALGVDLILNQFIGQCMVPGVYQVAIPSFTADITLDDTEFGNCTGITVSVYEIIDEP